MNVDNLLFFYIWASFRLQKRRKSGGHFWSAEYAA